MRAGLRVRGRGSRVSSVADAFTSSRGYDAGAATSVYDWPRQLHCSRSYKSPFTSALRSAVCARESCPGGWGFRVPGEVPARGFRGLTAGETEAAVARAQVRGSLANL